MFVFQLALQRMQHDCVDYMLQGRPDETRTAERFETGVASSTSALFCAMQGACGRAYLPIFARSEMLSVHPGTACRSA